MRFLRFAAIGAALTYFFDPQQGARRRNMARDRALALFRRGGRKAARAGRLAAAEAHGVKQKATHLREQPKDFDDQTLKAKIESEAFRPEGSPKGDVNVSVESGIVYLRGQVDDPTIIEELERRVRSVHGVSRIENLLHLPGTEAPTHSERR
jgi:osmotically-inducible protein OsmY